MFRALGYRESRVFPEGNPLKRTPRSGPKGDSGAEFERTLRVGPRTGEARDELSTHFGRGGEVW